MATVIALYDQFMTIKKQLNDALARVNKLLRL